MATVSGAHREPVTEKKDSSTLFLVYRSFAGIHILRNLFVLLIDTFTQVKDFTVNSCEYWTTTPTNPPDSSFLGQHQGAVSHKRFTSVERALTLTLQEQSLRMFYFFLSLPETSSYQACHFCIILMLAVLKPVRSGWYMSMNTPRYELDIYRY